MNAQMDCESKKRKKKGNSLTQKRPRHFNTLLEQIQVKKINTKIREKKKKKSWWQTLTSSSKKEKCFSEWLTASPNEKVCGERNEDIIWGEIIEKLQAKKKERVIMKFASQSRVAADKQQVGVVAS